MDDYPYTDTWKSTVDHNGEEWRAYCEAVSCLRHYFRAQITDGKEVAKALHHEYIDGLTGNGSGKGKKKARRAPELVERLRIDFLIIGQHEGERIKREVMRDIQSQRMQETA